MKLLGTTPRTDFEQSKDCYGWELCRQLERDLTDMTTQCNAWKQAWETQRDIIGTLALKIDSLVTND